MSVLLVIEAGVEQATEAMVAPVIVLLEVLLTETKPGQQSSVPVVEMEGFVEPEVATEEEQSS